MVLIIKFVFDRNYFSQSELPDFQMKSSRELADFQIETSMANYLTYSLDTAYNKMGFAWLIDPSKNDTASIRFESPITIQCKCFGKKYVVLITKPTEDKKN